MKNQNNSTTYRGDVAELMAASELVRRGYIVSRPLTNGAAYDILADVGGLIKKVQIKKACRQKNGTLRVNLSSSKYHRGRTSVSYFGRVDCLIAVECETGKFFVFFGDDLNMSEVSLRDLPAKNNQQKGTRLASSHLIDDFFPDLNRLVGGKGFEPLTSSV